MKAYLMMFLATLAASSASAREWRFDVSLDGRPIGEHRFVLRQDREWRELTSQAEFRVRFLFIDAFRYDHRAQEVWQGECLDRLEARTDANGKQTRVAGEYGNGRFLLRADQAVTELGSCVQTFAYWNPSILDAQRLLNPQTGEYVDVQILPMGREAMAGQVADKFRLVGRGRTPLEIDLWYTPSRDWLALESRTPEGRRLRYVRK